MTDPTQLAALIAAAEAEQADPEWPDTWLLWETAPASHKLERLGFSPTADGLAAARALAAALRALDGARHDLVTSAGLWATDNMDAYSDALDDGVDNDKAHDVFVDAMFHLEHPSLPRIDDALALAEPLLAKVELDRG